LLPGVVIALRLDEVARTCQHHLFYRGRCHLYMNVFIFLL
jgi:hypothetical protein